MKRIFFAPSRIVKATLASLLIATGLGAFSLKVNGQGQLGGTAGAVTAASPSSPSENLPSSSSSLSLTATADRTSVSVGDRVVVTYTAKLPAGATLTLDALVTPAPNEGARPSGGAVLEFENPAPPKVAKSKTGNSFDWSQRVELFPFAAGAVSVPGPHYTFEDPSFGHRVDVRPPSVELTVASRLPKDQKPDQLAPKADKEIRIPAIPAKVWAALGAAVALLAGLVWWGISRRRGRAEAGESAVPPVPPGEELRAELARLTHLVETVHDDPRGFYSDLTHAVKRYLERTTGEPVLEWTTFETNRRFREILADVSSDVTLPELLGSADRVKFAKASATRDDARENLGRARRLHDVLEAREAARRAAEAAAAREKTREKAS
jgi:hypothetical protein